MGEAQRKDRLKSRNPLVGAGLLSLSRFIVLIVGPIVGLLLVRYLGPEQYGIYAAVLAVTTLLSIFCDFGIQQAVLRFLVDTRFEREAVLRQALLFGSAFTLMTISLLAGWLALVPYDPTTLLLVPFLVLSLVRMPVQTVLTAGMQARGDFSRIGFWNILISVPQWAGTLALIALQADMTVVVGVPQVVATVLVALMAAIEGHRQGIWAHPARGRAVPAREFLSSALKFGSSNTMHQIYHRSDAALLSAMRSPLEVGSYMVAFRLIEFANALPGIVFNQVLYPKYFQWSQTNREKLSTYYSLMTKVMVYLGLSGALVLGVFAHDLVYVIYGENQPQVSALLQVMAWAIPARFIASSPGAVLTTDGQVTLKLRIQAVIAVVNVALNLLLIPRFGALAAGILMFVTDFLIALAYSLAIRTQPDIVRVSLVKVVALAILLFGCYEVVIVASASAPLSLLVRIAMVGVAGVIGFVVTALSLTLAERQELRALFVRSPQVPVSGAAPT